MSEEIAEVIAVEDEPGTDLVPAPAAAPMTLFGTDNPGLVLQKATDVANALAAVIEDKKLYTMVKGRKHVHVEGWTMLGSMLGVFPEIEWTRRTTDDKGADAWEARCVARTMSGAVVGAREAMCSRSESKWSDRDDYALKSMAQTRAISTALAAPLRFIVVLAGFQGTPEAEMPQDRPERRENAPQANVPRSWAQVLERLQGAFPDAEVWLKQAKDMVEEKQLPAPTFFQRMCGLVLDTDAWDVSTFPPVDRAEIQQAFAKRLDGIVLPGPEQEETPTP